MSRLLALLLLFWLAACVSVAAPGDSLDSVARDYVRTQLAVGEKEAGYIDAYYGPEQQRTEGKALAAREGLPGLARQVAALQARVAALRASDPRRAAFLDVQLTAAATRLRMLQGERLPFTEEARGLFSVTPAL